LSSLAATLSPHDITASFGQSLELGSCRGIVRREQSSVLISAAFLTRQLAAPTETELAVDVCEMSWPGPFLRAAARADIPTYHHDPRDDPDQLADPAAVAAGIRSR
jgi:hypothetical protein